LFSEVIPDGPDGTQAIAITMPITTDEVEFGGIVVGLFRVDPAARSVLYGDLVSLRTGQSDEGYLVDGKGWVIYHDTPARIGVRVIPRKLYIRGHETKDCRHSKGGNGQNSLAVPKRLVSSQPEFSGY
jgi:hypothetical protein